jgi:hypothetical protein
MWVFREQINQFIFGWVYIMCSRNYSSLNYIEEQVQWTHLMDLLFYTTLSCKRRIAIHQNERLQAHVRIDWEKKYNMLICHEIFFLHNKKTTAETSYRRKEHLCRRISFTTLFSFFDGGLSYCSRTNWEYWNN